MSLSIQGVLEQILNPVSGVSKSDKEWNKQEFVIETQDQYPKKIAFTLFGDKSTLIQSFKIGDLVEVYFNVESREFKKRWFHNVNAWKIDKVTAEPAPYEPNNIPDKYQKINPDTQPPEAPADDIPF